MDNQTNLLPLGAMARLAHVPAKWLREEAESGRIPHLNAGGRFLFDEVIVRKHLADLASRHGKVVRHGRR